MLVAFAKKRSEQGFTLIELLIVVAIIAILAAIAVPNFIEAQTRSKVSRAKADLRSAATAIEAYRVDYNRYPPTPFVSTIFDGGVLRVLPNLLSTPVSFLSSVGNQDVFISANIGDFQGIRRDGVIATYAADPSYPLDPGGDPGAGKRYYYQNNRDNRRSSGTQALLLEQTVFEGDWIIASLGPNRKRDFPANVNSLMPYDPTNGTVSDGDIIRTQKFTDGKLHAAP